MPVRRVLLSLFLFLLLPATGRAQTVTGLVVDASGNPVFGVVVLLINGASQTSGRALSTERGEFRLVAPRPGSYRIRTMRIGFKPMLSEPVTLAAGAVVMRRLVVTNISLGLDTMRVASQNVCRAFTDSGAATFAVWEQVRTALTAAELTAARRAVAATTVTYDRAIDPNTGRDGKLLWQTANVSTDYVRTAWRTLSPDSLRRVGYIVTEPDNSVIYYAPGVDMLLSPVFVEDHCFRLVSDTKRPAQLGIGFEPTPERKHGKTEIRGTLWLDRASSELRDLEFRYVNALPEQEDAARGGLSFVRMRDGTWAISRWNIRMPLIEEVVVPGHAAETRVSEIRVSGGALAVARQGDDTLWHGPAFVIGGLLRDSLSGTPLRHARVVLVGTGRQGSTDDDGRFAVGGIQPGNYTMEIHTASLDSMNATHRVPIALVDSTPLELRVPNAKQLATALCPNVAENPLAGIVVGTLRLRGTTALTADTKLQALHGARVVVEWRPDPADRNNLRRLQTPATSDGRFRVCGVPVNASLSLSVKADSAQTAEPSVVRIPPAARLARVEVALDRESDLAAKGASFTGVVVADSTDLPIPAAEVAFPDLGKSVLADSHGAFRVFGIPAGEQRLIVRRLGYGAAETHVTFTGHETVERRVVLGKAVTLDAVKISAQAIDRTMPGLEENMHVGLGHFTTREEFEKYAGMTIRTVLQQLPGMAFAGERGHSFPATTRQPPVACPDVACYKNHGYYVPEAFEAAQGVGIACYAQVYVDGVLMNGIHEPTEPFDLNTIAPENVEAVEWYSGPSQTPMKYARMGSGCGVLVIWTRRSF